MINIYCDTCDWFGDIKSYDQHLKDSKQCDFRDACCKSESIKDYEDFESDEICENCTRLLAEYYEDFWTDIAMGER